MTRLSYSFLSLAEKRRYSREALGPAPELVRCGRCRLLILAREAAAHEARCPGRAR
jgi:hypothetical protein